MQIEQRLNDLGIALPKVGGPIGNYVHAKRIGNLLYLSGKGPPEIGGRVLGMVNAAPDFEDHPKVVNGCSDLFVEVFGEHGRHTRSAVGMSSLPGGIPVEIEVIVAIK